MKVIFKNPLCMLITVTLMAVVLSGCSGGGGSGGDDASSGGDTAGGSGGGTTERSVIDAYVNDYIVPDYAQLEAAAANLAASAAALQAAPSEANLTAAKAAWVAAREPWEQSETALFGPVEFYGFDPAMDTWPVNQTDLQAVLNSGQSLTAQAVGNLDPSLKGFHTIEYLLFGNDGNKTAGEFTDREFDYLVATTEELHGITAALLNAWTTGINGQPPYTEELLNAGRGSASFPTEQSAVEQIVQGQIGICDEVANGKIADPFTQRNPNIVESQFSFNSIEDFSDNIRGVKKVLDTSLFNYIAGKDQSLADKLSQAVDDAIAAILRIPEPFRDAIQDPANDATIIAAQEATRNVLNILQSEVLQIIGS